MLRQSWPVLRCCQIVLALLVILKTANEVSARRHYRYNVYLDNLRRYHLWWDVNYATKMVSFRLLAVVTPEEWFGVGYSAYGKPTNADFFVHWIGKDGSHQCKDGWTDDRGILHVDDQQDYRLLSGRVNGHAMVVEYERAFDTCDNYDFLFDNGTIHFVFFTGKGHPSYPEGKNVSMLSPGVQRVYLLKADIINQPHPKDSWSFSILAPRITVPARETIYWWHTTKLPVMTEPHHIIQFESDITKGNEDMVHHIEVFHCETGPGESVPYFSGPSLAGEKPQQLKVCRKVIGAWAMGASSLHLPADAGYPVGGKGFSRHVLLEVHYNNPSNNAGVKDNSGIKFYVTPTLRKYDASVMEIGLEYTNKMAIPPHQKEFGLVGDCISECTKVGFPPNGIHIFASQLHTHLTGKKVTIRHVRNGVELPRVNWDDHYSPHYQMIKLLHKPVHILPGDSLVITCDYETLARENATIGGFAISDEMCVSYLHYYPSTKLEVCKSSVDTKALHKWFNFMRGWDSDKIMESKGYRHNYQSIRWTPLTTHLLNKLYKTSPLSMQCNQSDGHRFPGNWEGMPQTQIKLPLKPAERDCDCTLNSGKNHVIV